MAKTRKHTVPAITASDGSATVYSPYISGYIESVQYVKDDFTDGVDFTITAEATGENIWTDTNINASETVRPRAPTHSTAGVAALYAGSGTAVNDRIALGRDRVKIVIAAGGDTHSGTFVITTSDR
ncbi:hypothetical protein [Devosia sp. Root635]|uniref:hypothetical protein n=1 Tax=Devosia sp. Root635 TaxID=1736575 RepID=UPI0006FAA9A9|nr:hypothetical protein [Devosia sp. Root635]KRA42104.1 hypothetical protein ASD80_10275 [Devosia sp. Root635]